MYISCSYYPMSKDQIIQLQKVLHERMSYCHDEDIISSLIQRGSFHPILINILIHLDNESLTSVACCCRLWSQFIKNYVINSQQFRDKRLELQFRSGDPTVWIIAAGQFISCMTWDQEMIVVGRAQSALYTQDTEQYKVKSGMLSPLVFVYSRPGLEKIFSLYGHRLGVTSVDLDTRVIVSGSLDWTVRVWDRKSGTLITCLQDHGDWVTGVYIKMMRDTSRLFTLGLDNIIHCYDINHPDELEDFDSVVTVNKSEQCRTVPEDNSFHLPINYKQPLKTYLKQCGCLATSDQYLISSYKTMIHVWLEDTKIHSTLRGHAELVGQLKVQNQLLISSGCEKTVMIWSLETMTCLHVLNYTDKFNNVSYPKIDLDHRYLLVTTSDHIDIWDTSSLWSHSAPVKVRSVPVEVLIVSVHLERRGIGFSCYKSVQIMDFSNPDSRDSLFYGTSTKF